MANALLKADRPAEAIENVETAMRLDPHFPPSYLTVLGQAQFVMGQLEEAAETLEKAASRNPENDWNFVYLAATYGQLGHDDKAKITMKEANEIRARWGWDVLTLRSLGKPSFKWTGNDKALRDGLVKAGVSGGQVEWMALISSDSEGQYKVDGATIIDAEAAKAMFDRGVPFVDVYSRWITEHIPGAYGMELDEGEFNKVRLSEIVSKNQEVVVYGGAGLGGVGARASANASAMAVDWGFEKVHYFADGIDAWKKAGYPVEKP